MQLSHGYLPLHFIFLFAQKEQAWDILVVFTFSIFIMTEKKRTGMMPNAAGKPSECGFT
jgi:hypothetical protein